MKQVILTDEQYEHLMNKISENTYGAGLTTLQRWVIDNTVEIERK